MKRLLLLLCCALTALSAQTIEWKYGETVSAQKAPGGQNVQFDHLKPYATLEGKDGKVIYAGLYVMASVADGKLAGTAYYIDPEGFLGFGLDPNVQKLAAILPIERVEFCFPVEKGKWFPITFKSRHKPPACAVRVVDDAVLEATPGAAKK